MGNMMIPRRLGHIWVGDRPPPVRWMETWRAAHPGWEYTLYDNAYLSSRRWRNQALIAHYFKRRHFEGVADLMRYEILLDEGGFLPQADSSCLMPCDHLFAEPLTYTCYDRFPKGRCRLVPYLASAPGTTALGLTIGEIYRRFSQDPSKARQPWISVGNLFLREFLQAYRGQVRDLRIWPAYYFVPKFKRSPRYENVRPVYAEEHWATTTGKYAEYPADHAAQVYERTLDSLSVHESVLPVIPEKKEPLLC